MTDITELLQRSKTIAVVGLSDRPERASHQVAAYMQAQGYRIIPVNPRLRRPVLGERPCPDLRSVPGPVDIVDMPMSTDRPLPRPKTHPKTCPSPLGTGALTSVRRGVRREKQESKT